MSQNLKKVEKENFAAKCRSFKNWFELDVTVKIFGITILHWHYPPVSDGSDPVVE